jgi:uncharacterized protein YxjI
MHTSPTDILSQPLSALPHPIASINSCFCRPEPVTLHMRERPPAFSNEGFIIREAESGQLIFRVDTAALSLSDRKVLLDIHGQTIVHVRNELFAFRRTLNISADHESLQMLFRIKSQVTLVKTDLECTFRDVVRGTECRIGVVGDWRTRAVLIWLDQGNGVKLPVARVYRPAPEARKAVLDKQDYYVDIAPNVDAALMVLVCIALDDTNNGHSLSPQKGQRRGVRRGRGR